MQRFCFAIVLFVLLLFSATALAPAFAEPDASRNVSDRVRLERSEAPEEGAGGEAKAEADASRNVSDRVKLEGSETPETEQTKAVEEKAAGKSEDSLTQKSGPQTESEAGAQKQAATGTATDRALNLMGNSEQFYDRKGRPDPFAPFVSGSEPSTQNETQKELQRREPRTPLERMSLGQLQLTAVMETGDRNVALVEEASGKGYVVKKGTYIGNEGGRVTEILPDAVVIEEKYLDVFGNVDVRKKQMKLQK